MIDRSGIDRRTRRDMFCVPERRTGYDRRRPSPLLAGLSGNTRLFACLMAGILVMSAGDWLLTLVELRLGAIEGNPALEALLGVNPVIATLFKVLITLLVVRLMWTQRRYRAVAALSVVTFLLYFALISYHLGGLAIAGLA